MDFSQTQPSRNPIIISASDPDPDLQDQLNLLRNDLMDVSKYGSTEEVEDLLASGIHPDFVDENGLSPLMVAVIHNRLDIVKTLLDLGADINYRGEKSALMLAAEYDHPEIFAFLFTSGAATEKIKNPVPDLELSRNKLIVAIVNGDYEEVKSLLESGVDPNFQNEWYPPLMKAVVYDQLQIISTLLLYGANIDYQRFDGENALMIAASKHDHQEIFDFLIQCGADINIKDNYGWTALMYAANYGNYNAIRELIKLGATINIVDKDGRTPLIYAAKNGNWGSIPELIEGLVKKNNHQSIQSFIDHQDKDGITALMYVARYDQPETVQKLIKYGADINVPDNEGKTALIHAISQYHSGFETAQSLINAGIRRKADDSQFNFQSYVDHRDVLGYTALMYAARYDKLKIVQALLQAGAFIYFEDKDGRNAQELTYSYEIRTLIYNHHVLITKLRNLKVLGGLRKDGSTYLSQIPRDLISMISDQF